MAIMTEYESQYRPPPPAAVERIKIFLPEKVPSASQVLVAVTLLAIGGILLALSGITLTGTVIGLAVAAPLFVLFSPVLVPAAMAIGLAVTGLVASGALGLTALVALSWVVSYMRGRRRRPEGMEHAKRRMAEAAGRVGQRAKGVGQGIQEKAQEVAST
ncbi:oleosin 21.2 kDa-like [Phoenix dactylifera]|uniref:Oleosin 21.2 kDa-like n=1 Tax=Phoenix dactylifera TaxID=42345 RepID=A0A8B7CBZ3_PHODC|nr:oleosin 21.2 kDa-like [Phoenix dactylifera]